MGSTAGNFTESERTCGMVVAKRQKGHCIHLLHHNRCCSCVDSFLIIFLPPFRDLFRISLLHFAFEKQLKLCLTWLYAFREGHKGWDKSALVTGQQSFFRWHQPAVYILQCICKCWDENSYYALNFGKKIGVSMWITCTWILQIASKNSVHESCCIIKILNVKARCCSAV